MCRSRKGVLESWRLVSTLAVILLLLWGNLTSVLAAQNPLAVNKSGRLSAVNLMLPELSESAPKTMAMFNLSEQSNAPVTLSSGRIRLQPEPDRARIHILSPPEDYQYSQNTLPATFGDSRHLLPEMQLDFRVIAEKPKTEQSSDKAPLSYRFVPLNRQLQETQHPTWDYILGVGKVVSLSAQSQQLQVALPFALVEKNQNCVHNGALLLDITPGKKLSSFYYQISSETCSYFQADFWGKGQVTLQHSELNPEIPVETTSPELVTQSQPPLPLALLANQAKDIDITRLQLQHLIPEQALSALGVIYQGRHYAAPCMTRAGVYPFCEQLVLPSYSLAKSIFAGLLVMSLEQSYGDILSMPVTQWVAQCRTAANIDKWQEVTVGHLLDMSTGNFQSRVHGVDEGGAHSAAFFSVASHEQKLRYACNQFPRQSTPGTEFVYHTSDTYLLGAVLQSWWQAKSGDADADVFSDVLVKRIFAAAQLSELAQKSRRTQGNTEQPFAGYGLFLLPSDFHKLAGFIQQQWQNLGAATALLHSDVLSDTLQPQVHNTLATEFTNIRYNNSFWAYNLKPLLGCEQDNYVPYMMGYGGLALVFLRPDLQFYYVSDGHQYNWRDAAIELNKLADICRIKL